MQFQVAGPSGGAARPRDVEMERTRLEEKGIFSIKFLESRYFFTILSKHHHNYINLDQDLVFQVLDVTEISQRPS